MGVFFEVWEEGSRLLYDGADRGVPGPMMPARVIEAKRNGERLEPDRLAAFLRAYLEGGLSDAQMAAFLMAVCFRGLDAEELDVLVEAIVSSGASFELSGLPGPRVDKHSTGGVGDKVSLVLAPVAAELGLFVPMISGRALGHTGGTLDKLEAVPGFRTRIGPDRCREIVERVGCAIVGQSEEIAPLDRRLYDLRSVTATVASVPLIAGSIMGKKLAEDLTGLVLDVKVGRGAFLSHEDRALELARTMIEIGSGRGVATRALLTAMDRPLGRSVGNALEAREAFECLGGRGPDELGELVATLVGAMLDAGGVVSSREEGRERALDVLEQGRAVDRMARMVEAQGGDPRVVPQPARLPSAPEIREVRSRAEGFVVGVDPVELGYGVVELGGGRTEPGEGKIDPRVGFVLSVEVGERVEAGSLLGSVHGGSPSDAERGARILEGAIEVGEKPPEAPLPLIVADSVS